MLKNVVLVGGGAKIPGLARRLRSELLQLWPEKPKLAVQVGACPERLLVDLSARLH